MARERILGTEIMQRHFPVFEQQHGQTLSEAKAEIVALLLNCQLTAD